MNSVTWAAAAIAIVVMGFLVPAAVSAWFPLSIYMDVRKVYVENAREGEPLRLVVDRSIYHNFDGAFSVDLRREEAHGFSSACQRGASGVHYRQGAVYPSDLDMDWWMAIPPNPPCFDDGIIPAGRYYIITEWSTSPWWAFGGRISQSVMSNAFVVSPKG